ncbi:hypothetical protein HDZ31DRAFT_79130 [Schizophyllum fasciatum]
MSSSATTAQALTPTATQSFHVAVMGPGELTCPFVHLFADGERPPCVHTSLERYIKCEASTGIQFQRKEMALDSSSVIMRVCQGHTESHEFLIQYPSKIHALAEQSEALILLYSVASRRSFNDIVNHLHPVLRNAKIVPTPIIIVGVTAVGLDVDFQATREVSMEEGAQMAEGLGCPFFEIPVIASTDPQAVFATAAREVREARVNYAARVGSLCRSKRRPWLLADVRSGLRAHSNAMPCDVHLRSSARAALLPLCTPPAHTQSCPCSGVPCLERLNDSPLGPSVTGVANSSCSVPGPAPGTGRVTVLSCTDSGSTSRDTITGDSGGVDSGVGMLRRRRPAPLAAAGCT